MALKNSDEENQTCISTLNKKNDILTDELIFTKNEKDRLENLVEDISENLLKKLSALEEKLIQNSESCKLASFLIDENEVILLTLSFI